jgi:hypothetical protein
MKTRPILFNTEMVQAILAGNKTQTRRIVKGIALDWLQPKMFTPKFVSDSENHLCPQGLIGDQLWVRETFVWEGETKYTDISPIGDFYYKADFEDGEGPVKWKPSIFMPREACRIILEITDIKVERLQDISNDDAWCEGVSKSPEYDCVAYFKELWEKINGKGSWKKNPWVWKIVFKKID